jgi:hypothetical protein
MRIVLRVLGKEGCCAVSLVPGSFTFRVSKKDLMLMMRLKAYGSASVVHLKE